MTCMDQRLRGAASIRRIPGICMLALVLVLCRAHAGPVDDGVPRSTEPTQADSRAQDATPGELPAWLIVRIPDGWDVLPDAAETLGKDLRSLTRMGDRIRGRVDIWGPAGPSPARATLVITWIESLEPMPDRASVFRAEIDRIRSIPRTASLAPGDTRVLSWSEAIEAGVAGTRLEWHHVDNHIVNLSRMLIFQTRAGRVYEAHVECIRGDSVEPGLESLCRKTLESLRVQPPGSPIEPLTSIGWPDSAREDGVELPDPAFSGQTPIVPEATLRDPGALTVKGVDVPVITVPRRDHGSYHRWLYVFGGILLVTAMYLATRGRRRPEDGYLNAADDRGKENL